MAAGFAGNRAGVWVSATAARIGRRRAPGPAGLGLPPAHRALPQAGPARG
jgi:hypothetical protein